MRRAILFRYHTRPGICSDRIELLRQMNPYTPIYGMYGGAREHPPALAFDHNYVLPFEDPRFKWQNGDLCVRQWFKDCGYRFRFNMLHIVEWDLVYLKPLQKLFRPITNGVGITNRLNFTVLRNWPWITSAKGQDQLQKLRTHVRNTYGLSLTDETQMGCHFPGTSLSRAFLERYASDEIPELLHDEIRVPLYAQIYGLRIHDIRMPGPLKYWNCSKIYVPATRVYAARRERNAFHPVRDRLDINRLINCR